MACYAIQILPPGMFSVVVTVKVGVVTVPLKVGEAVFALADSTELMTLFCTGLVEVLDRALSTATELPLPVPYFSTTHVTSPSVTLLSAGHVGTLVPLVPATVHLA